jgi:hypothetical protein
MAHSASPTKPQRSDLDTLRDALDTGTLAGMDEEMGIYRGEVKAIMWALADLEVDVGKIVGYIEGDDEAEDEQDLPDS